MEAVSKAIRDDGYTRPFTIRRNDEREFPVYVPGVQRLIFYEIQEGGLDTEATGRESISIVDHPVTWRVFFDPDSNRVYRLLGFTSGTEFNNLVRILDIKLTAEKAVWLAEGFVELAYWEKAVVVVNAFEARRFLEDELYTAMEPEELETYMKRWLRRSAKVLENLRPAQSFSDDRGFKVVLTTSRCARKLGSQPKVEIRRLTILVARDGAVTVANDESLATAEVSQVDP